MKIFQDTDYDFDGTIDGDFIPSLPLNPLNTIFNKNEDLLPLSLMDSDFPIQEITPNDPINHYNTVIKKLSHPNTTRFFLSHSNNFNFSNRLFPEELSERMNTFCGMAMARDRHQPLITRYLKITIYDVKLMLQRGILRTTSKKTRTAIKKYLPKVLINLIVR